MNFLLFFVAFMSLLFRAVPSPTCSIDLVSCPTWCSFISLYLDRFSNTDKYMKIWVCFIALLVSSQQCHIFALSSFSCPHLFATSKSISVISNMASNTSVASSNLNVTSVFIVDYLYHPHRLRILPRWYNFMPSLSRYCALFKLEEWSYY